MASDIVTSLESQDILVAGEPSAVSVANAWQNRCDLTMGASEAFSSPCVNCGACCAHFRVQFYWREANPEDASPAVPPGFFEELTPMFRCMTGTAAKHRPKCAGLKGKIGEDAHCSIYPSRPTPCRAFTASYADGKRHERCDEARKAHGLLPLKPSDWT